MYQNKTPNWFCLHLVLVRSSFSGAVAFPGCALGTKLSKRKLHAMNLRIQYDVTLFQLFFAYEFHKVTFKNAVSNDVVPYLVRCLDVNNLIQHSESTSGLATLVTLGSSVDLLETKPGFAGRQILADGGYSSVTVWLSWPVVS